MIKIPKIKFQNPTYQSAVEVSWSVYLFIYHCCLFVYIIQAPFLNTCVTDGFWGPQTAFLLLELKTNEWRNMRNIFLFGVVCMFVCLYVRMYVCMYACMYVCMYVCTYVCMYLFVYVLVAGETTLCVHWLSRRSHLECPCTVKCNIEDLYFTIL